MSSKFILFICLISLLSLGGPAKEQTENLLLNPSMEAVDPVLGMAADWNSIQRNTLETHITLSKGNGCTGKNAVLISNTDPVLRNAFICLSQNKLIGQKIQKFTGNEPLEFSVMAKALDKPVELLLYFEAAGEKTRYRTVQVHTAGWQKVSLFFSKGEFKYSNGYVGIKLNGLGKVLLDDAYLGKVQKSAVQNYVQNGSFEFCSTNGQPNGWKIRNKNPKTGKMSIDPASAADGRNSFRFSAEKMEGGMFLGTWLDTAQLNMLPADTPMKLSLKANTNGNPGVTFRFYIERKKPGRKLKTFMSPAESSYFGWSDKALYFTLPKDNPTEFILWIQLITPGVLNVDQVSLVPVDSEESKKAVVTEADKGFCVRLKGLPARHTFIPPAQPGKMALEYCLPVPDLKVVLRKAGEENVLKSWNLTGLSTGKLAVSELEFPHLEQGAYVVEYRWKGGADRDFFRIYAPLKKNVTFRSDRVMLLNGKPFFPIGAYPGVETKEMLRVYGEAGFNALVLRGVSDDEATKRIADIFNKKKMAVIFNSIFATNVAETKASSEKEIRKILAASRFFDQVIGVTADELYWCGNSRDRAQTYYETFFRMAPDFAAWQNHAPRFSSNGGRKGFGEVRRFTRISDITGADIYPVPGGNAGHNDLPEKSLACVGLYTDLASETGWNELPVWMILQAFSWDQYSGNAVTNQPIPTYPELRFMVWNAITHGATGIFWYQPGSAVKVWYEQFGQDASNVNRELAAVSELMLNGKKMDWKDAPAGTRCLYFQTAGNQLFIAVNERKNSFIQIPIPDGGVWFTSPSGKTFQGKTAELAPNGVLILTKKPLTIIPAMPLRYQGPTQAELTIDGEWMAHPDFLRKDNTTVFFRQKFNLSATPEQRVTLRFCCDDECNFQLNGKRISCGKGGFRELTEIDISAYLKKGENLLTGALINGLGQTGIVYEIKGKNISVSSGAAALFSADGKGDWKKPHLMGKPPVRPWNLPLSIKSL